MNRTFKLCLIKNNFAYFTDQELKDQSGEDWRKAPYEDNADEPYLFSDRDEKKGTPRWDIKKVAFYCPNLETPSYKGINLSVTSINSGAVAWLSSSTWAKDKIAIRAGVSIDTFKKLILEAGGETYSLDEKSEHVIHSKN